MILTFKFRCKFVWHSLWGILYGRQFSFHSSTSFCVFATNLTISQPVSNEISSYENGQNLLLFVFRMIHLSFL